MQSAVITTIHKINPIEDSRWSSLVESHPQASVFHSSAWLEALRRSYGYESLALTTSGPGEKLENGIVFCGVRSWLTGNRLVSLSFADHCDPLVTDDDNLQELLNAWNQELSQGKWKSLEVRPRSSRSWPAMQKILHGGAEFCFHSLDLQPDLTALYNNLHKSCIQRKIKRAEREQFTYERGRTESLLAQFYRLLLLTRRRHHLPPQSISWFRNVLECMGERACIHLASKSGHAVASILTLSFRKTMVYKYGCSDARYHNLGSMPFLFWNAIQDAKERGAEEFDLGRSDCDQTGLIEFKDHLGGARSQLKYFSSLTPKAKNRAWKASLVRSAFSHMPDSVLTGVGGILYRHFG